MLVCSSFTNAYHVPVNTASHASSAAALKHALVHDASCMQLKSTCLPAPPSNAAQGDIKLSKPAHKHEDSFNVSFASPASCMVAVAKPSVAEAQRAPAAAAFNYGKKIFEIENVGFPQKKLRCCPTAPSRAVAQLRPHASAGSVQDSFGQICVWPPRKRSQCLIQDCRSTLPHAPAIFFV